MKRWIIFVPFVILLGCPCVSGAATDMFDRGQSTFIDYPIMKIPIGAGGESNAPTETKGEGEDEAKNRQETKKKMVDKKVDDAIKKAWGEK